MGGGGGAATQVRDRPTTGTTNSPFGGSSTAGISQNGAPLTRSGNNNSNNMSREYPKFGATPIERAQTPGPYSTTDSPGKKAVTDGVNPAILIQGGSLKTWSFAGAYVERLQVVLTSNGRPLDADVELWSGPDNIPMKMRAYIEDGSVRPFMALLETPRGPSTVAVRNIGQLEFPFAATVAADEIIAMPNDDAMISGMTIQGGALRTYAFDPTVDSVQVFIVTDGRPLNGRIELLQGPNNNKQVIELYTEDGLDRPFFAVLSTPGGGNVVRVVNTAPVEFPMKCAVVPNTIITEFDLDGGVVIGGDTGW